MRVLNNITAAMVGFSGEKTDQKSLTVPDQAMTPQELLRKFASGAPFGLDHKFVYDDDIGMEMPEFDKMDKLDRLHEVQENSKNVEELKLEFSDLKKKAEAKKLHDERSAAIAKSKAAKASESSKVENSNV